VKSLDIVQSHFMSYFMKALSDNPSIIRKQDFSHLFSNINKIAEAAQGSVVYRFVIVHISAPLMMNFCCI